MSRHSRISSRITTRPPPPQALMPTSSLDRPSAIPASAIIQQQQQQYQSKSNSKARKPAVAYTGLTGAGYTLSGQPGRFLLPEKSVSRAQDGAGTLDVWPAGKSALSASSAANKQERKRQKNRANSKGNQLNTTSSYSASNSVSVSQSISGGVQHETGSQPKLLQELEQFVESELNVLGVNRGDASEPNAARLQVYREAFRHFMEEFRTYKPFLSAVKNEYDSVLDKYARRLHYIPALRARLSTMEASTKQRVRREADAHAAEIRRIKITARATEERLKSLEKLNIQMIDDNVKITKELDLQRTRYLDMKTANISIVASLKKKDLIINEGQGDKQTQEDRATQLANQLEQLELKHDVVLIQLANLRNAHVKATATDTHQNVERLENELDLMQKEQLSTLNEHKELAKKHSEILLLVETLTSDRQKLAEELEIERERIKDALALQAMTDANSGGAWLERVNINGGAGSKNNTPGSSTGNTNSNSNSSGGRAIEKNITRSTTGNMKSIERNQPNKKGRRKSTLGISSGGSSGSNSSSNSGSSNSGSSNSGSNNNRKDNRNNTNGSNLGNASHANVSSEIWMQWVEKCIAIGIDLPPEYKLLTKKKSVTSVNMSHVIHLLNGLLGTLENGSFISTDDDDDGNGNGNRTNRNSVILTGARGVPINELRRLMHRMPPWKRKKDGKVDTSEITSITSVTTQKTDLKDTNKSAMFYFVGRGVDPEIPKFLRFNGRVRNRHMSKADIERTVKIVWIRKEQSRNKDHLADFFHTYLQDEFGPSQTIIAEQAYNIVHALERYNHDADCDMFLKILMGELPEQSFVDQQLLLQNLQDKIIKIDRSENQGIQTGKVAKQTFLDTLSKCVLCKTKARTEELEQALFFDCGGPVRKVNYIDVFQDDAEGNQGKFVEAMRDQYLDESIEYAQELQDALEAMQSNSRSGRGLNLNQLREAFLGVDPQKSLGEVDEYIARGCAIDVDVLEDLEESFAVDLKVFVKKMRSGILKRSTPPQ